VDPDWETDDEAEQAPAKTPQRADLRSLIARMPRWVWVIVASVLVVAVESIVARLVTPDGSNARAAWSLSQLAIGFVAVTGGHIINFLALAADDADIGLVHLP